MAQAGQGMASLPLENVSLHVFRCDACSYDLTGLARRGHCPECGNIYDLAARRGIFRDQRKTHPHRIAATWWIMGLAMALFGVAAGLGLVPAVHGWMIAAVLPIPVAGLLAIWWGQRGDP